MKLPSLELTMLVCKILYTISSEQAEKACVSQLAAKADSQSRLTLQGKCIKETTVNQHLMSFLQLAQSLIERQRWRSY